MWKELLRDRRGILRTDRKQPTPVSSRVRSESKHLLPRCGKIGGDAIVQREFHSQAWILCENFCLHLGGIPGSGDGGIPIGMYFLMKSIAHKSCVAPGPFMAGKQNHRLERHNLIDRLCPFLPAGAFGTPK